MDNFLAALMTLRCLDVAEQRLRSGFSITLPLYYKDVQIGCETHSLTGKTIVPLSFLLFPLLLLFPLTFAFVLVVFSVSHKH